MYSIHLNKQKIDYVKDNDLNDTKFTRKTHFHLVRNTVKRCSLQAEYDSEF